MAQRGVELSMNVIIIAAIALVVLVVLILLVTNAVRNTQTGTDCTALEGAQCVTLAQGETCSSYLGDTGYAPVGRSCPTAGDTCCFKPLGGGQQ